MTPARLARWAARFRRGELVGAPGRVSWDGAPPLETAFAAWSAPRGRCSAVLHPGGALTVKLAPGVSLTLPPGAVLTLAAPLAATGRLEATATATVTGGAWSLTVGGRALPLFDALHLTPDGRLRLGLSGSRLRSAVLRAGGFGLTAALRRSGRWPALTPWLAEGAAVEVASRAEVP